MTYKIKFNMKSGREHFYTLSECIDLVDAVIEFETITDQMVDDGDHFRSYFDTNRTSENFCIQVSEVESVELVEV